MNSWRISGCLLLSVLAHAQMVSPGSARGYIDRSEPAEKYTLPWMVLHAAIAVLEIEKVDANQGAVFYKVIDRVQGKEIPDRVKHNVRRDGRIAEGLDRLKAGSKAIWLGWDFAAQVTVIQVEGIWYTAGRSKDDPSEWWSLIDLRPDLRCAFVGTADELAAKFKKLLAGEAILVKCQREKGKPETQYCSSSLKGPRAKTVVAQPQSENAPLPGPTPKPGEAVPTLIEALADTDAEARLAVVRFLGRLGSDAKPAVPALLKLETQDPGLRKAVEQALRKIEGRGER
jgi:HEAT repeat protein